MCCWCWRVNVNVCGMKLWMMRGVVLCAGKQAGKWFSKIGVLATSLHRYFATISKKVSSEKNVVRINATSLQPTKKCQVKDRNNISASAASAASAIQQHQRSSSISSNSASAATLHQQQQTPQDTTRHHQTCIRHHQIPLDTTRHASDTTRYHQTPPHMLQTPPDMHQTMSDMLVVVMLWFI